MASTLKWFSQLGMHDVPEVGGKNASLGEMYTHLAASGVKVPNGFATTADAFRQYLAQDGLDQRIYQLLDQLDVDDVRTLAETGRQIRQWMLDTPLTDELQNDLLQAYQQLNQELGHSISVAIRSSATAEDLPEASFAGQQETLLNIRGEEALLNGVREVFASLFNDRAIAYRVHQGFSHRDVALSAGIQQMVRSDMGASGVMFTLDTESGFQDVVFINAAYGLGEMVVQGAVNPDEFYVHKPMLAQGKRAVIRRHLGQKQNRMIYAEGAKTTEVVASTPQQQSVFCLEDEDVLQLARHAVAIEQHYQRPMDIEWGKDGEDGELYILQARPETVKSRSGQVRKRYQLKQTAQVLAEGRSIGQRIASGQVARIDSPSQMDQVKPGDVLVTDMTDPDWEPIMKRASAIVTNRGGRTCHAAIIARELGIPAVVGANDATEKLNGGQPVTVSCAEGDVGKIYDGQLEFEIIETDVEKMPDLSLKLMMNVANPERAFDFQFLPNHGVGLARLEFIINRTIGIHPLALAHLEQQSDEDKKLIEPAITAYGDGKTFFIEKLKEGIATIAAAFWPKPVIVRMSDFKTNEYANLIGGQTYEPTEENPMIGFRGASRYLAKDFEEAFAMECRALKEVREDMGLSNVEVMIPFVRTVDEIRAVVEHLAAQGLKRGKNGLKLIMMCEIPSNALLADEFLQYVDGYSIGSNDLTQLTLGLDRDSGLIAEYFDENNGAVKALMQMAIQACKKQNKYIGICGQGPSDHPELAKWLLDQGIETVSLNPDTVVDTWLYLADKQSK